MCSAGLGTDPDVHTDKVETFFATYRPLADWRASKGISRTTMRSATRPRHVADVFGDVRDRRSSRRLPRSALDVVGRGSRAGRSRLA